MNNIAWAERFAQTRPESVSVQAAGVRGNELWLITYGGDPISLLTELYRFYPHGAPIDTGVQLEQVYDDGAVYLVYAWVGNGAGGALYQMDREMYEALEEARRKAGILHRSS